LESKVSETAKHYSIARMASSLSSRSDTRLNAGEWPVRR